MESTMPNVLEQLLASSVPPIPLFVEFVVFRVVYNDTKNDG